MDYEILLTEDALQDISELDAYIAIHDGPEKADYVLSEIEMHIPVKLNTDSGQT